MEEIMLEGRRFEENILLDHESEQTEEDDEYRMQMESEDEDYGDFHDYYDWYRIRLSI